jgi:glycosyltransferase involved in cell wall biosynthesis
VADAPNRGLTFTPEDPRSLAAVAATLVADPARRYSLGAAGRGWVVRERTWAANGQRYLEAYGRLGVVAAPR